MKRIVISEADFTTNGSSFEQNNLVYIPGFASTGGTAPVGVPQVCYSVSQFKNLFGATAPTFKTAQKYPVFASGTTPGFLAVAIPQDGTDTDDLSDIEWFGVNDPDPSYVYALSLLQQGLTVVYERMNDVTDSTADNYDVTVEKAYAKLFSIFDGSESSALLDKGTYNLKFITTGGYPAHEYQNISSTTLASAVIAVAEARGDCVAIIDHTDNPHRALEGVNSVIQSALPTSEFATMFTPWCECTNGYIMPASYVYLATLAKMLKTNESWATVAGISRGVASVVKNEHTDAILTNRIAESYQYGYSSDTSDPTVCINAITYINNYGYTIWGNRTLKSYTTASTGFALSFLNLRNLVSEVKKQAYSTAQMVMFEVNNDVLWTKFKANMSTLLDTMVSANGLKNYKMLKSTPSDKTKLQCQIVLYPQYSVESVNISIQLQDEDITVEE